MVNTDKPVKVVQLTDTHFFGSDEGRLLGVDTATSFKEVWSLVRREAGTPDFYLFTGDLSQDETEASYSRLAEVISDAGAPCYALPGNHDRRDELSRGLYSSSVFRSDRAFSVGNWLFVLLDSLVDGEVGGRLSAEELKRLDCELAENPDKHALVTVHHQVLPMGAKWLDGIGIANADEMLAVLAKHKHVKVVLWGHVHQEFEHTIDGVHYFATPSTCVQFKQRSDEFGVDPVPPGCRILELFPHGSVTTSVLRTAGIAKGLEVSSAGY